MDSAESCVRIYKPGDVSAFTRPDLRDELTKYDRPLLMATRKILLERGFVTDDVHPDLGVPLLAHQLLDRYSLLNKGHPPYLPSRSGALASAFGGVEAVHFDFNPEGDVTFERVVEVDMNHPGFQEFRKQVYASLGTSGPQRISVAIQLFSGQVAPYVAGLLEVELPKTVFAVRPFAEFIKPHHLNTFAHRMAAQLEANQNSGVHTAWFFTPGQLKGLRLDDARQALNLSEFSLKWQTQ